MEDKKKNEEREHESGLADATGEPGVHVTSSAAVADSEVDAQPAPDGPEGSTGT